MCICRAGTSAAMLLTHHAIDGDARPALADDDLVPLCLGRCRHANITAYLPLANAAAASTSFTQAFHRAQNGTGPFAALFARLNIRHSHALTPEIYLQLARQHSAPATPACFVTTLRDPATRLESGFQ